MLFLMGSNNNNNNSNSQQSANGKIIPLNKRRVFTVCNNMHAEPRTKIDQLFSLAFDAMGIVS
jgi:hypothetical protein